MASININLPKDHTKSLNTYLNKYNMDDHIGDNPFNLLNIDSPYYDMEEIHTNLCSDAIADSTFQYTSYKAYLLNLTS